MNDKKGHSNHAGGLFIAVILGFVCVDVPTATHTKCVQLLKFNMFSHFQFHYKNNSSWCTTKNIIVQMWPWLNWCRPFNPIHNPLKYYYFRCHSFEYMNKKPNNRKYDFFWFDNKRLTKKKKTDKNLWMCVQYSGSADFNSLCTRVLHQLQILYFIRIIIIYPWDW